MTLLSLTAAPDNGRMMPTRKLRLLGRRLCAAGTDAGACCAWVAQDMPKRRESPPNSIWTCARGSPPWARPAPNCTRRALRDRRGTGAGMRASRCTGRTGTARLPCRRRSWRRTGAEDGGRVQAGLVRLPFGIYDPRETYASGLIDYPMPRGDYYYHSVDWGAPGVAWSGGPAHLQIEAAGFERARHGHLGQPGTRSRGARHGRRPMSATPSWASAAGTGRCRTSRPPQPASPST